jgi:hypothetical protein
MLSISCIRASSGQQKNRSSAQWGGKGLDVEANLQLKCTGSGCNLASSEKRRKLDNGTV